MWKGDSWMKIQYEQDVEMWMLLYEYGVEIDVVEIFISWYCDDILLMLFIKQFFYYLGYKDLNMMYEQYYKKQFEYLYNCCGVGVYMFIIYFDLYGLLYMILFFEDFIQYVKSYENVEFKMFEVVVWKYKDDLSVYESESGYV